MLSQNNLTVEEINKILSNNQFLIPSHKKKLLDRLEYLRNNSDPIQIKSSSVEKYSGNIFSRPTNLHINSTPASTSKIINMDEFPIMNSVYDTYQESDKKNIDHIHFKKIIDKSNLETLFVDNEMILDYTEVEKMYKKCAIDRIHITYLELDMKLNIMKKLEMSDDRLNSKLMVLKFCLRSYLRINDIINMLKSAIITTEKYKKAKLMKSVLFNLNKMTLIDTTPLEGTPQESTDRSPGGTDIKFKTIIIPNILAVKKCVNDFMTGTTCISNMNYLQNIIDDLISIQNYIATEFDTKHECDYHISLSPDTGRTITLNGISSYAFHKHGDIHMKSYIIYPEHIAIFKKKHKINSFMSSNDKFIEGIQKYSTDSSNYVLIIPNSDDDCSMQKFHIYFTIRGVIPFNKGSVKIINQSSDAFILTSDINKPLETDADADAESKPTVIIPPSQKLQLYQNWLRQRSRSEPSLFRPEKSEYDNLSENLLKDYAYEDTDKNMFYVDYVFDQLQQSDNTNIVRPDMLDSFRELAYNTSVNKKTI